MLNNRFVMIGLYALAITGLGFALVNMTFMFYALTTNGILLFSPDNFSVTVTGEVTFKLHNNGLTVPREMANIDY